ncbi:MULTISPECIES: shikimate dehydrogenase [unclassified Virgibacillus]|uniref:shikimate dehydrogenase n=1 Tax=unclassified Virgibacillus TaxID=2620237 RepID=UPI0024DE5924|nr:shikimate dehydrogenase [Virgibacillus sp. LDC-1]
MSFQLGLIGFPIQHSMSPWIHQQFLQQAGLEGSYKRIEIHPHTDFGVEISRLKEQKLLHGFNVTVPYKQSIIPYLDDIDQDAQEIGAVNTVVLRNGQWIGYNTDGKGYVSALIANYPELAQNKQKRILVVGAGGAARGIYYALLSEGFSQVDIANRTIKRANEIAKLNKGKTSTSVLTIKEAEDRLADYDIIIQTTSVGMKPNEQASPIQLNHLKSTAIVSDIVYQPLLTNFLQQAIDKGAHIHLGHMMLLTQAQLAFQIWTRKSVALDNMSKQLKLKLEGR